MVAECWLLLGALVPLAWVSSGCLGFLLKWWLGFKSSLHNGELKEVILPWKPHGIISAVISTLPTFRREDIDPLSQWKECQSHIEEDCGRADKAMAVCGKYNLSHRTCALCDVCWVRGFADFQWALRKGTNGNRPLVPVPLWEYILCPEYLSRKIQEAENCSSKGPALYSRKKKGKEKTRQMDNCL